MPCMYSTLRRVLLSHAELRVGGFSSVENGSREIAVSGVEIVFSAKGNAELYSYEDVPLGPHDVRGRTLSTLISPGTELAWLNGDDFPIRPGYAAVFEVEAVGADVKAVRVG